MTLLRVILQEAFVGVPRVRRSCRDANSCTIQLAPPCIAGGQHYRLLRIEWTGQEKHFRCSNVVLDPTFGLRRVN